MHCHHDHYQAVSIFRMYCGNWYIIWAQYYTCRCPFEIILEHQQIYNWRYRSTCSLKIGILISINAHQLNIEIQKIITGYMYQWSRATRVRDTMAQAIVQKWLDYIFMGLVGWHQFIWWGANPIPCYSHLKFNGFLLYNNTACTYINI